MFLLKLGLLEPPTPTVRFLYILVCLLGLSWCLFVCLYLINVKTAEPIKFKVFFGSLTQGMSQNEEKIIVNGIDARKLAFFYITQ